jgi:peptidyl-prolyl cis-trans isomerase SurA
MNRAVFTRALGVAAVIWIATGWAIAGDTVIEEIIARVNNQIITRTDWQHSREQLFNQMREEGATERDARAVAAEKDLLRDLVDQRLLVQKGQDLGITADTELVKRLDELRKQMNLDSMEALQKAAEQQGVPFEEFKQNLRNNIVTQQVIQREVGGRLNIAEEEEKQYYEAHKTELEHPEQIRLSEILVTPQKDQGESADAAAEQKAKEALAEIKGGKSFAEVAQKYSNGPTAAQGGDLGLFKRGALSKELEDKTFAMKAGDVSDVIRTQQGFVVLKVEDHQEAGIPPFTAVQPRVAEQVYYQKLQPALRAYLTKLREDAFIDIKPGYTDTGASPNQTQPVMTAASDKPSGLENKKKKKKFLLF